MNEADNAGGRGSGAAYDGAAALGLTSEQSG